jgi:putative ABC transport system ATP-binding protein
MDQTPAPARLSVNALKSPLAGPFSLRLDAGQCAVVTGESGSGKSLLLRMIADLDVNEGQAELDGEAREAMSAPQWRRRVAYVAAEAGWWSETVKDHFAKDSLPAARALAQRLGLSPDLLDGPVARLSTGERQRLALIRALLLEPPVLLLDEPTGALDTASTGKVEQVVREAMGRGTAVVMVTHDLALAGRIAQARYQMADRRLTPL